MSESILQKAKEEIAETLSLSTFAMRFIGVSFSEPKDKFAYFRLKLLFAVSIFVVFYHVAGEIYIIILYLQHEPKIEQIVPLFHVCGYGALSIAKVSVLWYKKDVFAELIEELAPIWPLPPLEENVQAVKDKSLLALKIAHKWYFYTNVIGVWFYNITPIALYFYRQLQGDEDARIGYVWLCWYPFDKTTPFNHIAVYFFEILAGIAKVSVLWYKKDVFAELIEELAPIWPLPPLEENVQAVKDKSLLALKIAHKWYFYTNVIGVWFYNITPIALYFYRQLQGDEDARIGYVWLCWYPFDKTTPFNHIAVYFFEILAGQTCVWIMVSTDLLFSAMASHLCFLLRILQKRVLSLENTIKSDEAYYSDILENIKFHQRLIRYCADIEEAFSVVHLVNVVLSSVTICCVVFVIVLLEPLLDIRNKFFLLSSLLQIFVLCYYADDIIYASKEVGDAAYNSGWYRTDPKCRRALIFLIQRSQKPIAFTAMKFTNISLATFTSILTRSYSYFALLYTIYSEK